MFYFNDYEFTNLRDFEVQFMCFYGIFVTHSLVILFTSLLVCYPTPLLLALLQRQCICDFHVGQSTQPGKAVADN